MIVDAELISGVDHISSSAKVFPVFELRESQLCRVAAWVRLGKSYHKRPLGRPTVCDLYFAFIQIGHRNMPHKIMENLYGGIAQW